MSFFLCCCTKQIGDEVAVKCPPDPPYPEGWYTGVVTDVIVHGEEDLNASASNKGGRNYVRKSSRKIKTNFTINVEWDGGGDEEIYNPEWRLKGDAPDKQGRVSHRDAKVGHRLCLFQFTYRIVSYNAHIKCSPTFDISSP